jgi:hypothetical protein
VTLPGAFKAAGFFTYGTGKIFHEGMPADDPQDAKISWSPEAYYPDGRGPRKGGLWDPDPAVPGSSGKLAYRFPDSLEPASQDGNITDHAVKTSKTRPFPFVVYKIAGCSETLR